MILKPQGYNYVYFDWSMKFGPYFLLNDQAEPSNLPTMRDLVNYFTTPTVFIGESTFESYNLEERASVFELAKSRGHLWFGTPNRLTYRWRSRFGWDKDDVSDVKTIRIIAEYPHSLSAIRKYKTEGTEVPGEQKFQYNYISPTSSALDVSQYIGKGNWTRLREIKILTSAEQERESRQRRQLDQSEAMEFRRLDKAVKDERMAAFRIAALTALGVDPGRSKASALRAWKAAFPLLNDSVTWAVVFAARASDSRAEFEALLGAHAHGAKSMLRSQFFWWGWMCNGSGPMYKGGSLTDFRRQSRQLGALVIKNDLSV